MVEKLLQPNAKFIRIPIMAMLMMGLIIYYYYYYYYYHHHHHHNHHSENVDISVLEILQNVEINVC